MFTLDFRLKYNKSRSAAGVRQDSLWNTTALSREKKMRKAKCDGVVEQIDKER